jgi:hypothetical protein
MLVTIISFLSFFLLFLSSVPADSAVFNISSGDVTGLIAAINQANTQAGADTINLDRGTYTLTSVDNFTNGANGLPSITSDITINGEDAATTVIERDPGAPGFRIFAVAVSGKLTLNGLAVARGGLAFPGGGILNEGSLTINRSTLETSGLGLEGGGVFNAATGTLNLTNSFVIRNSAHDGAGIFNGGTAIVRHSSIIENGAVGGGAFENDGTATIQNSTISANSADTGGGILNHGTMTVTNSTIANNFTDVLLGGGIANTGTLKITNSTISGNRAATNLNGGGGGIFNQGILELQNTIVALNTTTGQPNPAPDCLGPITSLGNNLIGDLSGCNISLLPSDLIGDPGLGAFLDDGATGNGRFPLLAGSQAINAGNNAACQPTDQLDTPRLAACDIGAIEFYPLVNNLVALASMSTAFDPTPVPGGPAGTFRATTRFTNTSNQVIVKPFVEVVELTGGNLLLNANGGAGGVGARLTPPGGATTPFQPGASGTFEFLIGLRRQEPFTFLVNMLGEPQTSNPPVAMR